MSTWSKRIAWTIFTALLTAGTRAASAGDEVLPRYAVEGGRLDAKPARESSDGRYTLDARLGAADDSPQTGSGIALKAKLIATATAACDTSGLIFANSFE